MVPFHRVWKLYMRLFCKIIKEEPSAWHIVPHICKGLLFAGKLQVGNIYFKHKGTRDNSMVLCRWADPIPQRQVHSLYQIKKPNQTPKSERSSQTSSLNQSHGAVQTKQRLCGVYANVLISPVENGDLSDLRSQGTEQIHQVSEISHEKYEVLAYVIQEVRLDKPRRDH